MILIILVASIVLFLVFLLILHFAGYKLPSFKSKPKKFEVGSYQYKFLEKLIDKRKKFISREIIINLFTAIFTIYVGWSLFKGISRATTSVQQNMTHVENQTLVFSDPIANSLLSFVPIVFLIGMVTILIPLMWRFLRHLGDALE